jgi:DNA topoisomerase-2
MNGKDHASARYIFTELNKLTRNIFHENDDPILSYLSEEGQSIEPEYYMPIIPFVLVNGAEGIGTGWSTSIPNYNPEEIVENLKRKIKGEEMQKMKPWYKGYTGEIEENPSGGYTVDSIYDVNEEDGRECLEIFELPIKRATRVYKEVLEEMAKTDLIEDIEEQHTEHKIHFRLYGKGY